MRHVNTALAIGMLSDGNLSLKTISTDQAVEWLNQGEFENSSNPSHNNTLVALSKILDMDMVSNATGARFIMNAGDECLVMALTPPPGFGRETREFTDDEIAQCKFSFRLVKME